MDYQSIYELMGTYEDQNVELAPGPVSVGQISARLRTRLGGIATPVRRFRPLRRTVRTALIAAVLALAMSVTAYAVYQWTIKDLVIENAPSYATVEGQQNISLVGYRGTAEYKAYTAWSQYLQEHPVDYDALGADDSWHTASESDWSIYGAATREQAEKLQAIAGEYGLALHTARAFADGEELYDLLGTEPLIEGDHAQVGGYVYEDGSFKLDASEGVGPDLSLFVSGKGSFAMIAANVDGDFREWSYETASGETVDLVLEADGFGDMLYETEGAYVFVRAAEDWVAGSDEQHIDQAALEAAADSIDFAALADRFDGKAHPETAEAVKALAEQQAEEDGAALYGEYGSKQAQDEDVLTALGDWRGRLEGFTLQWTNTHLGATADPEGEEYFHRDVECCYKAGDGDFLLFGYIRCYGDEDMREDITDAVFAGYGDADEQVAGCPAVFRSGALCWLDESRDVIFSLAPDGPSKTVDRDGLMALAEELMESVEG